MANKKSAKVTVAQKNLSIETLIQARDETRDKHLKAEQTIKKYKANIRRGQEFLAKVVAEKRATALSDSDVVCDSGSVGNASSSRSGTTAVPCSSTDIDEFSHAFDDVPNLYSAMALELFLVEKCINQGCAKSVNGISAAFCYLWDSCVPVNLTPCLIGLLMTDSDVCLGIVILQPR
jgi:hypothetical protein